MSIQNTVLYLLVNAFHIYVFFLAYRILLGTSCCNKWLEILGFVAFYILNSTVFLIAENPYLNLITTVASLALLTLLYPGRRRSKVICCVFVYLASMLLEGGSQSVLSLIDFSLSIHEPIVINIMADLALFMAVIIFRKWRRKNEPGVLSLEYCLAVLILPVGSMAVTILVYRNGYSPISNLIIVAILIAGNVLVFHLYEVLNQYYSSNYERQLLRQQNAAYAQEIALIQKTDEATRKMRHDLKNHMAAIGRLLDQGQYRELKEYLGIFNDYKVAGTYVKTGNAAVDSIVNYKLSEADAMGTRISVKADIPTDFSVQAFDLSVILGNLLDNANEALRNCEERSLELEIYLDRGVMYIECRNTYNGKVFPSIKDGQRVYATSKMLDRELHGLGLSNVAQTVEKYQGDLKIEDSDHLFSVSIMLFPQ